MRTPHATPQLNLLAPLAATPIHKKHSDELVLDDLCSDISHQGRFQNAVDRLLIETHPDIFPNFYLLPTPHLDRAYVLELREFLLMATARIRWLLAALDLSSSGILDIFSEWRSYRLDHRPGLTGGDLRHYYRLRMFREDFIDFLRPRLSEWPSLSVRALFDYEEDLQRSITEEEALPALGESEPASPPWEWQDCPRRQPKVYVLELDWDIQAVLKCLQKAEQPSELLRRPRFYATRPRSKDSARVVEIGALGAFILRLSTGALNIDEIVERFTLMYGAAEQSLPADTLCISLIEALIQQRFLAIHRSAKNAKFKTGYEAGREYSAESVSA